MNRSNVIAISAVVVILIVGVIFSLKYKPAVTTTVVTGEERGGVLPTVAEIIKIF